MEYCFKLFQECRFFVKTWLLRIPILVKFWKHTFLLFCWPDKPASLPIRFAMNSFSTTFLLLAAAHLLRQGGCFTLIYSQQSFFVSRAVWLRARGWKTSAAGLPAPPGLFISIQHILRLESERLDKTVDEKRERNRSRTLTSFEASICKTFFAKFRLRSSWRGLGERWPEPRIKIWLRLTVATSAGESMVPHVVKARTSAMNRNVGARMSHLVCHAPIVEGML